MKKISDSLSQVQTNMPGDDGSYTITIWKSSYLQSGNTVESDRKTYDVTLNYDPCYESSINNMSFFAPNTLDFNIEPANEE